MLSISISIPKDSIESIENDYEFLKTMYQDEIHEIKKEENRLSFLLKQKYEIEISSSLLQLLKELKLDELIINSNLMYLPYWIKYDFNETTRTMNMNFYIYWYKYNKTIIDDLSSNVSSIDSEPYIYNVVEATKSVIDNSLDKNMLINFLQEIKEKIIINMNLSIDNFLLSETGANANLNFWYEQKEKPIIAKLPQKEEAKKEEPKEEEDKDEYELFCKEGGYVGETRTDRASTFQAHAIKVQSIAEVNKFKRYLLSQKKIKKATHNISAYRFIAGKSGELFENFDDDGEHEAGTRLLGIMQKMKVNNVFVVVSRWFGGILLHHDRFKDINDVAKNLLNEHINEFK